MEEVRFVEVECLRDTAEGIDYYRRGERYTVPSNHPCMQHFEILRDVKEKEITERVMDDRPRPSDPYRGEPAPLANAAPEYQAKPSMVVEKPLPKPAKKSPAKKKSTAKK